MKRAVRHKNEMVALNKHAQRCDQFAVKRFQMALGSPQERLFKAPHVIIAHAELGDLKTEQLQEVSHSGKHGHRDNPG